MVQVYAAPSCGPWLRAMPDARLRRAADWPARFMVPLQPAAGVDVGFAQRWLAGLQSHNCTDAREWPMLIRLEMSLAHGLEDAF